MHAAPLIRQHAMRPSTIDLDALSHLDVQLLEQIFDQTQDIAFFVKDAEGRYRVVNDSLVERNGLKRKRDLLGRRACEVVPGDLGRIPTEQDLQVLRSGRPIVNHLELHWRMPHRPVWCLTTKLPIQGADGRVRGLIGISRDLSHPIPASEIPAGMARAIQHLERHFHESISPAKLARRAGLSAPRFARLVKRVFGITPSQLIAKTRVAAAAALLRDTNQTVAEIAIACGFCDHSAFTRAFKSSVGITPTAFRAGAA